MPADPQPILTAAQLGLLLKTSRKARHLTQAGLAERLGISQSRVSSLELDPAQISVGQLMAWCAALGLEFCVGPRASQRPDAPADAGW